MQGVREAGPAREWEQASGGRGARNPSSHGGGGSDPEPFGYSEVGRGKAAVTCHPS